MRSFVIYSFGAQERYVLKSLDRYVFEILQALATSLTPSSVVKLLCIYNIASLSFLGAFATGSEDG